MEISEKIAYAENLKEGMDFFEILFFSGRTKYTNPLHFYRILLLTGNLNDPNKTIFISQFPPIKHKESP